MREDRETFDTDLDLVDLALLVNIMNLIVDMLVARELTVAEAEEQYDLELAKFVEGQFETKDIDIDTLSTIAFKLGFGLEFNITPIPDYDIRKDRDGKILRPKEE